MERTARGAPPPRRYDASRRQADADARRRRVVEAARRLFLERGYGATAIADIAREAEVSAPTVYAQFESKAGILAGVVDASAEADAAAGHGEADDRGDAGLDARSRVRALALATLLAHRRRAAVVGLVESVAGGDPALAALAARLRSDARATARAAADGFDRSELRPGLDGDDVARILHTVAGVPVYLVLTGELGLSDVGYGVWLDESLARLLLPDG